MPATPFVTAPWGSPQAVWSVLVTAPTVEPLTLSEAKIRAGLTWPSGDSREPMLADFIRAARTQVEHDTGLALLTQTRDVFLAGCSGPVPLPSQTQPVQTITQLTPTPLGPVTWVWPYVPGVALTLPSEATASYRVVAGWPSPTALRSEAPSLLHAVGLLVAHYATMGRDLVGTVGSGNIEHMVMGYEEAISPHRLIWVP